MVSLLKVAQNYFAEQGWPVTKHAELPVLRFEYQGDNGEWVCFTRIKETSDQVIFLSVLEEKVPEDKRVKLAEFLTRANFGLNIGNFEMDFEDGEIRYKTSLDVSQGRLTTGLFDPLVKASLVAMDDYLPGIRAVLAGTATPKQAVEDVLAKIEDENSGYDLIIEN